MKKKKIDTRARFKPVTSQRLIIYAVLVVFIIYAGTLIFPFVWMLLNSVRTSEEFLVSPFAWPNSFNLISNYSIALFNFRIEATGGRQFSLASMFLVSAFLTLGGTALSVIFSAMLAYTVCKYKFRGRNIIYTLVIFALIVPLVGTLPATFELMTRLRLFNTFPGIFIMYSASYGMAFLLLYGFYKSISWSYAEAAFIDGSGHFGVFFKIMLPLSKPALIAVGIIAGIGIWNDYGTPAIFLRSFPPLAVGLNTMSETLGSIDRNYPVLFAAMLMAVAPIIIIFAAFQKTIMKNTVAGGLKG